MRKYEALFMLRPDLDEESTAAAVDKFTSLIESHGGEITKLDKWGKRKLAYEVKHFKEAYYTLIQMNAEPEVAQELDRVFRITDTVLRHIIVREDE